MLLPSLEFFYLGLDYHEYHPEMPSNLVIKTSNIAMFLEASQTFYNINYENQRPVGITASRPSALLVKNSEHSKEKCIPAR